MTGYIIAGLFMLMDIVSGLIKSLMEKGYDSSIMREGLYHKTGSVICITMGILIDEAMKYYDLGFSELPVGFGIFFAGYVILMEIGSIFENVCAINPDFMPDKVKDYLGKVNKK